LGGWKRANRASDRFELAGCGATPHPAERYVRPPGASFARQAKLFQATP
jgi:hypothetical protein